MRNVISVAACVLLLSLAAPSALGDSTKEFSVQLSARVEAVPPEITLSWPQDTCLTPIRYTVHRKGLMDAAWGPGFTLPGTATTYTDYSVGRGVGYEYEVVKTTAEYTGYGYIYSAIDLPPTEDRGRLLLVVDRTYAAQLAEELARLQQDLVGDGWTVTRLDVGRLDSVPSVKSRIKALYEQDPAGTQALFLFGHVPVPYSGDIVEDGHAPSHQGAWACDGYYGDMDGAWTDNSVNDTNAADPRNRNVPGDGKFDQSCFPAPIKLMVGRVDLANMPGRLKWDGPPTFPSELSLLRNYLNKDHAYRQKQFVLPQRAVVGDFFGVRDGEAFAASAWRNFVPFFGPRNVIKLSQPGAWVTTLTTNAALFAYGGGPGCYNSIEGLGHSDGFNDLFTTEMVSNNVKTVFALLFGSWLGDWDSQDNILRGVLALPSYGLASALSGRPHWFIQHMALGEPIGFDARLTQNNGPNGLYRSEINNCAGQIHIALMGDPTLRLQMVAPPTGLTASPQGPGTDLAWKASAEPVIGYYIYRAPTPNGPFTRLTPEPIVGTSYIAGAAPESATATYMVRALKLETSASGAYYNLSQGAFVTPPRSLATSIASAAPGGPRASSARTKVAKTARAQTGKGSRST
jgi:hypothetical protein